MTGIGVALCAIWFGMLAVQVVDVCLSVRQWRRGAKVTLFGMINVVSCAASCALVGLLLCAVWFPDQFGHWEYVWPAGRIALGRCLVGASLLIFIGALPDRSFGAEVRMCGSIATVFNGMFLSLLS
jgi:hypothetical protein